MRAWFLGFIVLLAACRTEPADDGGLPGFSVDGGAAAEEACVAKGGTWTQAGLAQAKLCIEPTRDANQSCSRESDCEGLCLARSRTCAPVKPLFGCHDVLTNSGTQATICID